MGFGCMQMDIYINRTEINVFNGSFPAMSIATKTVLFCACHKDNGDISLKTTVNWSDDYMVCQKLGILVCPLRLLCVNHICLASGLLQFIQQQQPSQSSVCTVHLVLNALATHLAVVRPLVAQARCLWFDSSNCLLSLSSIVLPHVLE